MDKRWSLSMEKPKPSNAFTLLETMLVLLIVCILTIPISFPASHLSIFMKQLQNQCLFAQEKAYIEKRDIHVSIQQKQAIIDAVTTKYPHGITCSPVSFHYNSRGNISQGNTVLCRQNKKTMKLFFQLGQGRVRIE